MAGVKDIKRRIKSVSNIQQITKALKMVAAARIKKAEDRMKTSRPYAYKMQEVVTEFTSQLEGALHPLMDWRKPEKTAVVVVSADKGLCGSYNNNVLRMSNSYLKELNHEFSLIALGQKAKRFFAKRGYKIEKEFVNWTTDYDLAKTLAFITSRWFIEKTVDEVVVFYSKTVSALNQKPLMEKILPIKRVEAKAGIIPYIFEPSPFEALSILLPKYLEVIFFQILLEAKAAELGARLRAMSNATDNAEKLVHELTLKFFRARQESITTEILEVASGAEALKI